MDDGLTVGPAGYRRPLAVGGAVAMSSVVAVGIWLLASHKWSKSESSDSFEYRSGLNVVDPVYVSPFDRVVEEAHITPEESSLVSTVQVVIARYSETLEWYNDPQYANLYQNTIVYNKGPNHTYFHPSGITEIQLPNLGCESHSYIHHIIHNYDHLADLTVFLPGSSNAEIKLRRAQKVLELANMRPNRSIFACWEIHQPIPNDFTIGEYTQSSASNRNTNKAGSKLVISHTRPLGAWLKLRLGVDGASACATWNAIFAISKRDILKHPLSYYQAIFDDLSVGVTCEAGHYAERAWFSMFGADDAICFYEPKN
jgi:Protein of unknown function (DUF3431)